MQPPALNLFLSVVHKFTPSDQLIGLSRLVVRKMHTRWYLGKFRDDLLITDIKAKTDVNTYVRITPVKSKPVQGRGLEIDSAGTSVLWIDYDCYSHQLEGVATLQNLPIPPTLIINSGRGLQAYWQLDRFYTDLERIKACNKALLEGLDPSAADSCYDLARVLRVPDTFNMKDPDRPVLCSILSYDPDQFYSLDQFPTAQIIPQAVTVWDQSPLDDDFLDDIKVRDKKLFARLFSEETARKVDAPTTEDGAIDRSRNDFSIVKGLLKLGYSPEECLSVLTSSVWLSGRKYQITGRYDYVVTTVNKAVQEFNQSPDRFFAKSVFQPPQVSRALVEEAKADRLFLYANEQLYRYDGGYFCSGGEEWLRERLTTLLGRRWSSKAATEAVTYIIDTSRIDQTQLNNHPGLVNTLSGMVDLETGAIVPHSPAYFSLHQIPVHYDPGSKSPELDAFIAQILPSDAIPVFWEYVGSVFAQDRYWPKAYLALVGPGNTGKSKLLEWVYLFLGVQNCAAFSLQALADNRFTMGYLYGKIANIFADLDEAEAKSIGQIKALTGDDTVTGERKGKSPFHYKSTARLFFSANHYPSVKAPDEPFFDRSIIIPCTKKFFDRPQNGQRAADNRIVQKLSKPEIFSAGLNRAIEGLRRIEKNNGLSSSPSIQAAQAEFRIMADTIAGFLGTCVYEPGYSITRQAFYQQYRFTCELAGRSPFSADKFFKRLQDVADVYGIGEEYKTTGDGSRVWCYTNRRPNLQKVRDTITINYPTEVTND